MYSQGDYKKSAEYIRSRIKAPVPKILLTLGTGLGALADLAADPVSVPYCDIPRFNTSSAPGHMGRLVVGKLCGIPVFMMQGRLHAYEGYTPEDIVYPLRTLSLLGVKTVILTNAAGAVNESYRPGDIMIISDHIKLAPQSPLTGENLSVFGPRFCDMSETYDAEYRRAAKDSAEKLCIRAHEGVYFYFQGPQYETPAEIRAARALGGDAVGMSTVFEAIAASHMKMRVLGISLMSNMASGISKTPLSSEEVESCANKQKDAFSALVLDVLPMLL